MLALLVSLLLVSVDSVMFHLEANARKCLAEEIRQNTLVTGEFEVSEAPGQQVNMMVTDTSGHHLVNRKNIEQVGKFAFTTDKDDIFEICFISRVPSNVFRVTTSVGTFRLTAYNLRQDDKLFSVRLG